MGRQPAKGPHDETQTFEVGDKVWLHADSWEILGEVVHELYGNYTVRLKRVDGNTEDTRVRADRLRPAKY